ncbi:MAG TPA: hypothetical protein VH518_00460 [Tepidisphaeraceae bacterium]
MRRKLALILIGICWFPAFASAQPAEVSRVLRTFDFEERRLGNPEELPMHWGKVDAPGLPHYVNGRLSTDRARSGEYSFRFDLNGGSLIYRYDAGQIKVQAGAHYRVEGYVQTTALPYARARITAYFADQDGGAMPATIRHSETFASKPGDLSWQKIGVEISASAEEIDRSQPRPVPSSLVVELELLQPAQYSSTSLGQRALFMQDIRGSAWFDDITVSQVPRVTMSTDRPGNIFRRSDPMVLKVLVNDRFTDDLAAQLVISDAQGKAVYQRSGALDMSAAQTLGPGRRRMTLALPNLSPGWYEAALVMTSQGQFVGKQTLDMVLLADDAPASWPDPRFGIVATDLPYAGWDDLPQILTLLSAGRVKLAVWNESGDVQTTNSAGFDRLLEHLAEQRIEPTACLVSLPPDIASKLMRDQSGLDAVASANSSMPSNQSPWLSLLKVDTQLWQPQLAYMLSRHATHLQRWQLGADGSDEFVTQPQMRQVYNKVYTEFARLIEHPDLAMPWPAWYELDGQLPATVALHIKPDVLPAQVPLYVKDLESGEKLAPHDTNHLPANHNLSIYLEPLERAQYGRDVQIRDLAQRMVYALAADARRIDLKLPFTVIQDPTATEGEEDDSPVVKQPQELLIIIRTVMTILGGATFKGKVPVAEGVEAFLFDRGGQGILVMWDRGVTGGVKQLAINLGEQPSRVDLWGNVTPLIQSTAVKADETSTVKLEIGPMPVFLVGIDGPLAQLRASVAFDNPLLESSFKPHSRKIRFVNPYHQAISGSVKLTAPAGWVINPPSIAFSLNPGEVFERDLTIEFPYNSFAGPKAINAEFQVQADNNSTFTVPIMLKLGLSDVGLQTLALRDGTDIIVHQMITNYGDKPIDYTAFAIFPGQPRQERLVTNLAAGRTTIKKYRFTNVKFFPQAKVRSGLKELDGTRILNDEVTIQ